MATLKSDVVLPEWSNTFFKEMANLLPNKIYNCDTEFMIPRLEPVEIKGSVVPLSTVKVFVNGVDRSPVPDIIADADGNWSGFITMTPGENSIQVQFFPPELTQAQEATHSPTFVTRNTLTHPTLFSAFTLGAVVTDLVVDGSDLFIGGTSGTGPDTMAKFDMSTGVGTLLAYGIAAPAAGVVRVFALDSNWLYSSQTLGDSSVQVSRYAKDFSTRIDRAYATVPNALHSDGTNLFAVRSGVGGVLLTKVDPSTMTLVGVEVNILAGSPSAGHEAISDDGTNLMVSTFYSDYGDFPTNGFIDGTPPLGSNMVTRSQLLYKKVRKSDLVTVNTPDIYSTTSNPTFAHAIANSLVYLGGYHYALVMSNPGKIIKMQEGTRGGNPAMVPIEVIPLPISTVANNNPLASRLRLGPDSRLYVAGNPGMARYTPGSSVVEYISTGAVAISGNLSYVATADNTITDRVLGAPISIFSDRAHTYNIVAPPLPPTNVACRINTTYTTMAIGWTPTGDGSAYIIEQAIDDGAFSEVAREYFGNGCWLTNEWFPGYYSGKTIRYRVSAFNSTGQSAPSAEATLFVPYSTPPLGDATNLSMTTVVGTSVSLLVNDGEITLGGPIDSTTNRLHRIYVYRSTDNINWSEVNYLTLNPSAIQPDGYPYGAGYAVSGYYNPSTRSDTLVNLSDNNVGGFPCFYKVRVEFRGVGIFAAPGAYSNVIQVDAPPGIPTSVVQENSWEGLRVSWTAGVGGGIVTGHKIYRSVSYGAYNLLDTVPSAATAYLDASALVQSVVSYKIVATGPGGGSSQSSASANFGPIYKEITGPTSAGRLLDDATYVYITPSGGASVRIDRVLKTDSSSRTSFPSVYTGIGTTSIYQMIWIGGYIFMSVKVNGEASCRILKIDPATMTTVGSISTGAGSAPVEFVTDGTSYWLLTSTPNKIVKFDPDTLSVTQTGPELGTDNHYACATYMSGDIYVGFKGVGFFVPYISKINTSTLAATETLDLQAHLTGTVNKLLIIGSYLYALGGNGIHKYSIGPLAWVSSGGIATAYQGAVVVGTDIYCVGNGSVGISKADSTPTFVSNVHVTHMTQAQNALADAAYIYMSNMSNSYIVRESISSF